MTKAATFQAAKLTRLALGQCVPASCRAAWLVERRRAQSSSVRPPFRREPSDGSTLSRTAPARNLTVRPECFLDPRHRPQLPNGCRAHEQPLVCAVPTKEKPLAVRRPSDGAELPGTGKERSRACSVRPHEKNLASPGMADGNDEPVTAGGKGCGHWSSAQRCRADGATPCIEHIRRRARHDQEPAAVVGPGKGAGRPGRNAPEGRVPVRVGEDDGTLGACIGDDVRFGPPGRCDQPGPAREEAVTASVSANHAQRSAREVDDPFVSAAKIRPAG
jgi:hypothetical protein